VSSRRLYKPFDKKPTRTERLARYDRLRTKTFWLKVRKRRAKNKVTRKQRQLAKHGKTW
jgi:hypothetical protein